MKRGKIQELKAIEIEFLKYLRKKTSPDSDFGSFFSAFKNAHDLTEKEKRAMLYRVARGQFAEKVGAGTSRTYKITEKGLNFLEE